MSKRWKVRKQNAAKREKSREIIDQFYGNVIGHLERMAVRVKAIADQSLPAETVFTCDGCEQAPTCRFVFDAYNTNGDCLAAK